ncbi:MAG TPA: nucleotidyltransferase domain-containing protein [Candidatus Paceibacterota bacterium]|nr:nucleotidyltransferase domain-containing protein [Candidatus Paceibacterota bacterium]
MSMEEKITKYLVKKYDPSGIISIGSRVDGSARKWSDWDLFVFTDKTEDEVSDFAELREFEGEALEVSPYPSSVSEDFILDTS